MWHGRERTRARDGRAAAAGLSAKPSPTGDSRPLQPVLDPHTCPASPPAGFVSARDPTPWASPGGLHITRTPALSYTSNGSAVSVENAGARRMPGTPPATLPEAGEVVAVPGRPGAKMARSSASRCWSCWARARYETCGTIFSSRAVLSKILVLQNDAASEPTPTGERLGAETSACEINREGGEASYISSSFQKSWLCPSKKP